MKLRSLIWCITNSFLLLFFSYFLNNCSLPFTGGEMFFLKHYEAWKNKTSSPKEDYIFKDSFALINTCYNLELIDHYGDEEFPQGKIAITNRADLYHFLKKVKELNTYKYIMIDIDIDEIHTNYNDSIKDLITHMRDICVARSRKFKEFDKKLDLIAARVDYTISPVETGFVKYELMDDDEISLPYRMYRDMYSPPKISLIGPFYFEGVHLCQKSLITVFKIQNLCLSNYKGSIEEASYTYFNLGINSFIDEEILKILKDKIVVLGDFFSKEDKHDTYVGELPGVIINLNTFINLVEKKHFVRWDVVLVLFVLYSLLSFWIIQKRSIFGLLKIKYQSVVGILNNKYLKFILSFCSFAIIFYVLSLFLYILIDYNYNAFLPVLWFTIVPKLIYKKIN